MNALPQLVPQDVCLSCDGCCRFAGPSSSWRPRVAREEIDGQGSHAETLFKQMDEKNAIKTIDCQGQSQCAFFQADDHSCQVYAFRPFECRLYPFLLVKKGGDLAVGVHLNCPFVQEAQEDPKFHKHVQILQRYFGQEDVLGFVKRNAILAGDYAGYEREIKTLFILDRSHR